MAICVYNFHGMQICATNANTNLHDMSFAYHLVHRNLPFGLTVLELHEGNALPIYN